MRRPQGGGGTDHPTKVQQKNTHTLFLHPRGLRYPDLGTSTTIIQQAMTLKEYQTQAMTTCMSTSNNFSYMFLNLVGEVGEFSSKIAKLIRKGRLSIESNHISLNTLSEEEIEDIKKELGDILWQMSGLCSSFDWSLEDIAKQNLDKLKSRKERGVIDGSGDNR